MSVSIGEEKKQKPETYLVYLTSGQIHTEFVFELEAAPVNWEKFLGEELVTEINPSKKIKYISIGWGEKRFFYEMATWDQLTFELAFSAIFLPSRSAVHVELAETLSPYLKHYRLYLSKEEYLSLYEFIKDSFDLENGRPKKIDDYNYYKRDRFFWGKGNYHLFRTCNMWSVEGLKKIKAKRPLWSPGKQGIDWTYSK